MLKHNFISSQIGTLHYHTRHFPSSFRSSSNRIDHLRVFTLTSFVRSPSHRLDRVASQNIHRIAQPHEMPSIHHANMSVLFLLSCRAPSMAESEAIGCFDQYELSSELCLPYPPMISINVEHDSLQQLTNDLMPPPEIARSTPSHAQQRPCRSVRQRCHTPTYRLNMYL